MRRRIKQKERLLLYLKGKSVYVSDAGLVFASWEITQDGIAEALGIGRNNVPRLVRPLIEEGYVQEWKARINGHTHRRKVYTLTPKGFMLVKEIEARISQLPEEYINTQPKVRMGV